MQYLTLVFIGCISISSLRGFLKNMSKVICAVVFVLEHCLAINT